jgi:hypothetical protein
MANNFFVPKSNSEMQQWYTHVEQVLRGQAKNFKDDSVQSIDRIYIADGIKIIRMRDFPRKISLPEAQQLDERLVLLGIDRNWLFSVFKIKRYGEMYESEMCMIMDAPQTWVNLYKKHLEPKNEQGQTLQEALVEEVRKIDEGLPKSFLKSTGN